MNEIHDYWFYHRHFHKIKPKVGEIQPLKLRKYQERFFHFWDEIQGPQRIVVLKPRQAGFSTIVASKFTHWAMTRDMCKGIAMADKHGRTQEIATIYKTFLSECPKPLIPRIGKNNTEEIFFDLINSGIKFETAQDPNAGRSGTRKFCHWSEIAFCRYSKEIDDGVQNSIPLHSSTAIIKESTANGRGGIGKYFYDLWNAAKRGDSIYKPFFVAWYEVDDYIADPTGIELTEYEKDIMKRHETVSIENLAWRRLKLTEYLDDDTTSFLTPAERFKQDFPLDDREAFLSTGSPVFDTETLARIVDRLNRNAIQDIKEKLRLDSFLLRNHWRNLKIYIPPRKNKEYFIGADVSEGLAIGDASSLIVIDEDGREVCSWHGKIDADVFGHLLMEIGEIYNNAMLCPEVNNMGHTTITTIKNNGYPRIYKTKIEDKVTKEISSKLGWRTTAKSKNDMLNEIIRCLRKDEVTIFSARLAEEMIGIAREENGNVNLNGKDRTVALGLALMSKKQFYHGRFKPEPKPRKYSGTGAEAHAAWEQEQKQNKDWY